MAEFDTSLFIFRRDLRLDDNTGLNAALALSKHVVPCFIFDPRQTQSHPYQSAPGFQFMLESLADLTQQCRLLNAELLLQQGLPHQVISELHQIQRLDAVFINRDYTVFSRQRDYEIAQACAQLNIRFFYYDDALLNSPEQLLKDNGSAYQVFTPFHKRAKQLPVAKPQPLVGHHFIQPYANSCTLSSVQPGILTPKPHLVGGRQSSLAIFQRIANYPSYFNRTELNASSQLSAYLKFGTCSIREAYYAVASSFGIEHELIRQFYWRDFFTHIAYHFPHVFKQAFNPACNAIAWDNNIDVFNLWCQGKTGFPIVDAGMRQLNATGFMPNRLRMITASFLVKDLHISWRWGERYFAQRLIDYDPCLNNGNWQWSASTGCDAQPYFRIFNPWLQQKKFDPDARYIYQWLPELSAIPVATLHAWDKHNVSCDYPKPIVDHSVASTLSKQRFQAVMQRS